MAKLVELADGERDTMLKLEFPGAALTNETLKVMSETACKQDSKDGVVISSLSTWGMEG